MDNFLANNYPKASPPVQPLQLIGQLQGLVHQAQVNKLTGAQIAMGKNYAQAMGPNGQLNEGQLAELTAQNPETAMLAGQVELQGAGRVHAIADAKTAELGYAMTQNQDINQIISAAMANPTTSHIQKRIVQLASMKVVNPTQAADLIASMPPGNDPEANKRWILQHQLQNQQVGEQLKTIFGNYQVFSTGANNVIARVSPVTGVHPVGSFPAQLTPGTLAQPFSYVNPQTGQQQTTSLGTFLGTHGLLPNTGQPVPNIAAPGGVPAPGASPQAAQPGLGGVPPQEAMAALEAQGVKLPAGAAAPPGAMPPGGLPPPAPGTGTAAAGGAGGAGAGPASAAPGQPPGAPSLADASITTGLGPAQTAALGVAGHQSAAALTSLEEDMGNSSNGSQVRLQRMRLALNALEHSSTGAGTDVVQEAKNYIQSMGAATGQNWVPRVLGIPPKEALAKLDKLDPTAQYALATKYLTQMAMAQGAQYGAETNDKLAAAVAGNPNTHMPQLAAEDVLKVLMGMERYHQAEFASWRKYQAQNPNVGPQDFLPWSAQWTLKTDPRIFLTPNMTPAQTAALEKQIPKDQQAQFIARWKEMKADGLLQ